MEFLIKLLGGSFWLQNLVARIICRVPPEIHHNFGKLAAMRKAFAYTNMEGIAGDYLEFGVFHGTSFVAAINSYESQSFSALNTVGGSVLPCRFFGFDSFEGLRNESGVDPVHPIWTDKILATNYQIVEERLKPFAKRQRVRIVKGFYNEVLSDDVFQKELQIDKVRVCMIDCDLKSSTRDVIRLTSPYWQAGTVLLFDDYFSYRGQMDEGETGALMEFCKEHPEFQFRHFGDYGYNGTLLIVTRPPEFKNRVGFVAKSSSVSPTL